MENIQTKIALFKCLFKGREDVFAKRWENDAKSGYMPVYFFDPYRLRAHKIKGGTFQNYPDKTYLQLTDDQIVKHLNGEQVIGLYPPRVLISFDNPLKYRVYRSFLFYY